ncbi:nuclear transport factor 2 family protein [Dactylosporangium sp. NPDC005572]|uniref:nuclear transport factor 2 family protein n=1 Tax=Dactylosporangium sp. NPDC005572 TaxID=3156889 RepID=UPI0033B991A2
MGEDALVVSPAVHGGEERLMVELLAVVDAREWARLAALVAPDVVYHRPGLAPIEGVDAFVGFYRRQCIVSAGRHQVDRCVSVGGQGFCWGRFGGVSHAGVPLNEIFADWFEFRGGLVARRRTFFYRPAI